MGIQKLKGNGIATCKIVLSSFKNFAKMSLHSQEKRWLPNDSSKMDVLRGSPLNYTFKKIPSKSQAVTGIKYIMNQFGDAFYS